MDREEYYASGDAEADFRALERERDEARNSEALWRRLVDEAQVQERELRAELGRLRVALAYYGDMGNYERRSGEHFHALREAPPGTIARLALAGVYDVLLERYTATTD